MKEGTSPVLTVFKSGKVQGEAPGSKFGLGTSEIGKKRYLNK